MLRVLLALLLLLGQVQTQEYTLELDIRKRIPSQQSSVLVGKLTVLISQERGTVESDIEPFVQNFVQPKDFTNQQPVILEFEVTNTNHPHYQKRIFTTSVDEFTSTPHGQKISIITGSDTQQLSVNSINYVQTRDRVGEIYAQVLKTEQKVEEIFKYQQAQRKSEAQEESFFSRYKWPLIIGGVLIYTMLSVDPAKAQAAAGGQGA